jgi:hypothetical protein
MSVTDGYRQVLTEALNATGIPEAYDGPTWTTDQMIKEFEVKSFAAPFVIVRRRSDDVKGTLMFIHNPRVYFRFTPSE